MDKITLTHAHTGQVWGPFDRQTVIGRDEQCDLPLTGRMVSKVHCQLEPSGNGWALVDLDSTNGTFIAEDRITRARVTDGELIAVGDVPLMLSLQSQVKGPALVVPAPAAPAVISRASAAPVAAAPVAAAAVKAAAASPSKASLWDQASDPTAAAVADGPSESKRSLLNFENKSQVAVIAALVFGIVLCIGWSTYCIVGRSNSTPRVPQQLAPAAGDPSV
jgi:predicted component of type VI protein secretion system